MGNTELFEILRTTSFVARIVLIILFGMSVISWLIIFYKFIEFRHIRKSSGRFLKLFRGSRNLRMIKANLDSSEGGHVIALFNAGYDELIKHIKTSKEVSPKVDGEGKERDTRLDGNLLNSITRVLQTETILQQTKMEKYLGFLATTGNTAPFVGLFGTVWGIMEAFRDIGLKGSANLATVAPGIAEALIATAAGIAVAIPAVIAFNMFNTKISKFRAEMEAFCAEFLSLIERALQGGLARQ